MALILRKPTGPVAVDWQSPWSKGLIADFEFEQNSGVLVDLVSGQKYTQTGVNKVITTHGTAADFALGNNFSISGGFAPTLSGAGQTYEILCAIDAYDTFGALLFGDLANYCFILDDTTVRIGSTAITVSVDFNDAVYRVLHFCGDASGCELFVDGVTAGSTATAAPSYSAGSKTMRIGGYSDGAGNNDFDGRIVYARLFNRRFTAREALARATWAQYAHLKFPAKNFTVKSPGIAVSVTADKFTLTITTKNTSVTYNVSIPANKFTASITPKTATWAISSSAAKFLISILPKTTSNSYNVSIPAAKFSLAVTMKGTAQAISSAAAKFTLSISMKTLTFTGEVISLVARVAGFIGQNVGRLLGR